MKHGAWQKQPTFHLLKEYKTDFFSSLQLKARFANSRLKCLKMQTFSILYYINPLVFIIIHLICTVFK